MNGSTVAVLAGLHDDALQRRVDTPDGPRSIQFVLYAVLRHEQAAAVTARWRTESAAILAHAQSAFRELEAVLAGRPATLLDALRDGEWTLRVLLRHVIAAEVRYAAQVHYSATRTDGEPVAIPPDRLPCDRMSPPEAEFGAARTGGLGTLIDLLARARQLSDEQLANLPEDSLRRPSLWGQLELDVRERLHQIGAHIIEATIQVEKMLTSGAEDKGEARAIVRRIMRTRGLHERATPADQLKGLDALPDGLAREMGVV